MTEHTESIVHMVNPILGFRAFVDTYESRDTGSLKETCRRTNFTDTFIYLLNFESFDENKTDIMKSLTTCEIIKKK